MSNSVAASDPAVRMTAAERRATVSLASIYGLRLLGMFIILPVFALYAETLPGGDLPVPMEHPIVAQTIEDCLHEAMDVDGFLEVLRRIADGRIATSAAIAQ